MVIISEILIMANFGHLLPRKATICDYSMEDSFSNHSVFSKLEIRLRDSDSSNLFEEVRIGESKFVEFCRI